MQRHAREEEGDERGAFRAGETQRGVERKLAQPARREREEDAPARAADSPRASRAVTYLGHDERYEREREQHHGGDEHGSQGRSEVRRVRSATMRRSTPGSRRRRRNGSAGRR